MMMCGSAQNVHTVQTTKGTSNSTCICMNLWEDMCAPYVGKDFATTPRNIDTYAKRMDVA